MSDSFQTEHKTQRTVRRFSANDDTLIKAMIHQFGEKRGIEKAAEQMERTVRSVEERYKHFIVARRTFTPEECQQIVTLRNSGLSFKEMKKYFQGATPLTLRIQYMHSLRYANEKEEKKNIEDLPIPFEVPTKSKELHFHNVVVMDVISLQTSVCDNKFC